MTIHELELVSYHCTLSITTRRDHCIQSCLLFADVLSTLSPMHVRRQHADADLQGTRLSFVAVRLPTNFSPAPPTLGVASYALHLLSPLTERIRHPHPHPRVVNYDRHISRVSQGTVYSIRTSAGRRIKEVICRKEMTSTCANSRKTSSSSPSFKIHHASPVPAWSRIQLPVTRSEAFPLSHNFAPPSGSAAQM